MCAHFTHLGRPNAGSAPEPARDWFSRSRLNTPDSPSAPDTKLRRAGTCAEPAAPETSNALRAAAAPIGARVRVAPNHTCMTAAAHRCYHVVDGGREVIAVWDRVNGW